MAEQENMKRIDGDEELQEDFFITLGDEMASDDEPAYKKWRRLKAAYEKDPSTVNDLLMTLCGWTMGTLMEKTLGDSDPLADYSEDYRKGIAYVMKELDEDDKAIIRAECNKAYKMHLVPDGDVVDDSKIIDLLEEYGQDHDLPEGWYEEEYDSSEILAML